MKDVLENKLYPGFDLTFRELKAIKAEKKETVSIIDYSNMIWVREAIEHLVKEINDISDDMNYLKGKSNGRT